MTEQQPIDPALWRGLTQSRTSRRGFLKAAGAGAGALSLSSILAACGTSGVSTNASTENGVGSAAWWSQQQETTTLNYANWPYYIDVSHGKHPSLDQFKHEFDALVSPRVKALVEARGIELIRYQDL